MESQDRRKLRYILLAVAAFAAVICIVAVFFFRSDLIARAVSGIINLMMPFIYGIVIAYLLHPVVKTVESIFRNYLDRKGTGKRKGLIRLLAVITALVLFLLILVLLVMAVLPEIIRSISNIVTQLPSILKSFSVWIEQFDKGDFSHDIVTSIQDAVNTLTLYITDFLKNGLLPKLQTLLPSVTKSIRGILNVLSNFGLGCIVSAYILGGWEVFVRQIKQITYAVFPTKAADWLRSEAAITNRMFSGFVYGKLLDSAIIGIICLIFTLIANVPYAVLISVVVGVTNLIPFFGPYIGAIPSIILIFTISPLKSLIFLIFIVILQQFDGNFLGPKILGDKLGLSAFWILFSILVFGGIWGVFGMLIGAPLFAVLYDLIRRGVFYLLRKRGLTDMVESSSGSLAEEDS